MKIKEKWTRSKQISAALLSGFIVGYFVGFFFAYGVFGVAR